MFDHSTPHDDSTFDAPTRAMPVWPPPERPSPGRRLLAEQPMQEATPWPVTSESHTSLAVLDGPPWRAGLAVLVAAVVATLLVGVAWMALGAGDPSVEAGETGVDGLVAGPETGASPDGQSTPAGALPLPGGDSTTTWPTTSTSTVASSVVPSSSVTSVPTSASVTTATTPTTGSSTTAGTASSTTGGSSTTATLTSTSAPADSTSSTMAGAGGSSTSVTTAPSTSTSLASTSSTTVAAAPPASSVDEGALRQAVLDLTNAERAKAGCGPLKLDATLTAVADAHSADMAARSFFSHTNPDGLGPGDRIDASGYPYRSWAENIAAGQGSAAEVMNGWMNSSGHRANILNCGLEELGVGYAEGPAMDRIPGRFWTQVFGARR